MKTNILASSIFVFLFIIAASTVGQSTEPVFVDSSYYQGVSVKLSKDVDTNKIASLAAQVRPSARQLRWQEYGMLGFIHFNLNTFTGRQWGTGKENLSIFNPTKLNAQQWVQTFKSAGIKSVILVAKHHDGLTLWPSSFRSRTIAKTPYKGGKGDIVREFVDACRAEGIGVSLYYSPWDKQEPYGTPAYNDLMVNELTELLTNYGLIDLVWFDGAGIDPKTSGKVMDFDWQRIYRTIRSLQPQALISGAGPDIRWVGNESGKGRFTEWSVQGIQLPEADFSGYDSGVPLTVDSLGYRNQLLGAKQLAWYPARGGLPLRHQWFWTPGQQNRSLRYLVNSYFETVGQNSNLLVNLSPDTSGLIPNEDVQLMDTFGNYLDVMYRKNYAEGAIAKAAETREGGFAPNYLFDDDLRTCWVAPEEKSTGVITIDLYRKQKFNVIKLQENIVDFGQRIEAFEVDAWIDSSWQTIGRGTTIGMRRLLKVPETTTNRLRVRIIKSRQSPSLASLQLFRAPEIRQGPQITRGAEGEIEIEGQSVQYTIDGSDPSTDEAKIYDGPFELPLGGVVRAMSVSKDSSSFFQEGRKAFSISPKEWKIKAGKGNGFILDNDPTTVANFNLDGTSAPSFIIQLPTITELAGFSYIPPQGTPQKEGRIEKYTLFIKDLKGNWKKVKEGQFDNIDNNPVERKVKFKKKVRTKEVKFQIDSATRHQKTASIAEFKLYSD